ncbi:MAG TPA: hypothetical protein VN628_14080 [Vicinamibacterales bacterium]|nr:hypothetical protein [Vicinamibacterales bacterium]
MDNPLFSVTPLYIGVGFVIAVLVVQEYVRFGLPRRRRVRHSHRHHHRSS